MVVPELTTSGPFPGQEPRGHPNRVGAPGVRHLQTGRTEEELGRHLGLWGASHRQQACTRPLAPGISDPAGTLGRV